ncbi:hypothetical protein [Streptomyces sp. C3-3]|uniref:hypothetical protein n=1 Tax=Streptomyces sp. C3-3 TaxID=2824901 RepID=UPI001B38A2E5|nr:hypothetical protein [Streptomyces sp. C3-3]MBQ1116992.1 hypothetical protein [Streptomyces sp. C3-3]
MGALVLDDALMENQQARIYAVCAVKLDEDHTDVAEGTFDAALTNALVAIVAHEWSGEERKKPDRPHLKSARELLGVVKGKAEAGKKVHPVAGRPEVYVIPDPHPVTVGEPPVSVTEGCSIFSSERRSLPPLDTRIDFATLTDALEATQATRHGREGGRPLERRHVDALLALDDHTSLMVLDAEREDRHGRSASEEDHREQVKALKRLNRLGNEEADRRAAIAAEIHEGYHPKHHPAGLDLQDCPVCQYPAFSSEGGDELSMQIGIGQCLVCHYERSSAIAEGEAREMLYEARLADD